MKSKDISKWKKKCFTLIYNKKIESILTQISLILNSNKFYNKDIKRDPHQDVKNQAHYFLKRSINISDWSKEQKPESR